MPGNPNETPNNAKKRSRPKSVELGSSLRAKDDNVNLASPNSRLPTEYSHNGAAAIAALTQETSDSIRSGVIVTSLSTAILLPVHNAIDAHARNISIIADLHRLSFTVEDDGMFSRDIVLLHGDSRLRDDF